MEKFYMTIILLGTIQGFILSGLLFWGKKNRKPNRLLAALIFLMSLASLNLYGNWIDWFHNPWLRLIAGELLPMIIAMPLGPLIYFYIRSQANASFSMSPRERRHFYPIILDLVPNIIVILYFALVLTKTMRHNPAPWGLFIDTYNVYVDIPRWLSVTVYVWLAHRYLKTMYEGQTSQMPVTNLKWLRLFIKIFLVFQVIWFIYLVPYVIPKYTYYMERVVGWYPIYIPLAIMIYWLGIKGFMVSYQAEAATVAKKASTISSDVIDKAIGLLKKAMEADQLYLNPNCNLTVVSQHTGLPAKTISAVLNQHLNKSFNEYLNGYRVSAFKKKILEPGLEHLTITGIAFDCGFNSQATFQRTFKEFTGMSPTEFRKNAAQNPISTSQIRI